MSDFTRALTGDSINTKVICPVCYGKPRQGTHTIHHFGEDFYFSGPFIYLHQTESFPHKVTGIRAWKHLIDFGAVRYTCTFEDGPHYLHPRSKLLRSLILEFYEQLEKFPASDLPKHLEQQHTQAAYLINKKKTVDNHGKSKSGPGKKTTLRSHPEMPYL